MQKKLSKIIVLIGFVIIFVDIVSCCISDTRTLLSFSTVLFFLLISSLVNLAMHKKLFCKKDFSPIVFLIMLILTLILDPDATTLLSIYPHSLFWPIEVAIPFSFLLIVIWYWRNLYIPTGRKITRVQTLLIYASMGLMFISAYW